MSKRILVTGVNGQVGNAIMDLKNYYPFKLIPVTRSIWDMSKEPEKIKALSKQYQPDVVYYGVGLRGDVIIQGVS